ncbi:MAG: glutathione S-transferase family protein [Woeseiaceae bacterium]|nr:glutathione S-transferase family protein [Woeseiaceae bacterium]
MSSKISQPRFKLYYWPLTFRGCFVSYLFAYRDVPLLEIADFDEILDLTNRHPSDQDVPFMGPPVLQDLESGRSLSQMPAIVLLVAGELDLIPEDPFDEAMCMKVLMDCNDVLMEICRYNGSMMWEREAWAMFRLQRFPRWLDIFEESLKRGFLGRDAVNFADIGVFALFGKMIRCLPELEPDVLSRAPGIHAICQSIGSKPSLAQFVADQDRKYGKLYCDGQIEQSIRKMLKVDAANK